MSQKEKQARRNLSPRGIYPRGKFIPKRNLSPRGIYPRVDKVIALSVWCRLVGFSALIGAKSGDKHLPMVVRCVWFFVFLAFCCLCTSASFLTIKAQEVKQGGSGTGVEGEAAEAEEAYKLGILFAEGGDHTSAFDWFVSAAERGHIEATYWLARAYAEGRGTVRDDKLAVSLFQTAVKAGHTGAMGGLGLMYFGGRGGLAKSVGKAEELFRGAAQRGNAQAMYNLGNLYARGGAEGTSNLAMAYVLLEMAEQNGIKEAQVSRVGVEARLSLAQRTQVEALRAQWRSSIEANK